jgi:hypothetical protein
MVVNLAIGLAKYSSPQESVHLAGDGTCQWK